MNTDHPEKEKVSTSKTKHGSYTVYTLNVFLIGGPLPEEFDGREISRLVQIRGDQTLEELHRIIFTAFDRWDDHMFEFNLGKGPADRSKIYSLPHYDSVIEGEQEEDATAATIDSLGLTVNQPFGYWFDFGDDWQHQINVVSIEKLTGRGTFPKIIKHVGESPPQYPDLDNEDETNEFPVNRYPLDDFEGFTPYEMHGLLYATFDEESSPMVFHPEIGIDPIFQVPLLHHVLMCLLLLREREPLKLTQKGNLPRFFCQELYNKGIREHERGIYKQHPIMKEEDSPYIHMINLMTRLCGLTRKYGGKIRTTKKCRTVLDQNAHPKLFQELFTNFTRKFNWGYPDRYPDAWIIQGGFGFSILLVQRYGDVPREVKFYAKKFLQAFPSVLEEFPGDEYFPSEDNFTWCYYIRGFERFLKRFGLIEIQKTDDFSPELYRITKNKIIDKIITWKV